MPPRRHAAHWQVLFYHSVALNIALNSHNNMLITLLISNNFVELKSNVFKRCERENLFQIAYAAATHVAPSLVCMKGVHAEGLWGRGGGREA